MPKIGDRVPPRVVPSYQQPAAPAPQRTTSSAPTAAPQGWQPSLSGPERVAAAKLEARVASVPNTGTMSALRAHPEDADKVAAKLKTALLDPEPRVVSKALDGVQVASAYTEIAGRHRRELAPAGYPQESMMSFPKVAMRFDAQETKALLTKLASQDPAAVARAKVGEQSGLIVTDPPNAIANALAARTLTASGDGRLAGSQGLEVPSGIGVKTFQEEFRNEVIPAKENLEKLISGTADLNSKLPEVHELAVKAGMAKCPMARGNHAKGLSLDKASMAIDPSAPPWLKEVLGNNLEGGKVRVSESHSDPFAGGKVGHMPGVRFDFPVGDQTLSFTMNGGATTHEAKSIREHTEFSLHVSKPLKDGVLGKLELAGRIAGRVADVRHENLNLSLSGLKTTLGEVKGHLGAVKNAKETSEQVLGEKFNETTFYARHTYNIGGRNVQVYLKPVGTDYGDARGDPDRYAYLNTVRDHVAKKPMELDVYMVEMQPGDDPKLIEQEAWNRPGVKVARITVPPQNAQVEDPLKSRSQSAAESYFDSHPFIPGGKDKVAQGMGVLGRERVVGYAMSAATRLDRPITDFIHFDQPPPPALVDP